MTPVILVARREDGGWRDSLWAYAKQRWQDLLPEFSIAEGVHEGPEPFSFSRAINDAARIATSHEPDWDVCLYVGADWLAVVAAQCVEAAGCALECGNMTFASNETVMMTEAGTEYLLNGGDLETAMGDGTRHPNTFSGVVAVSRVAWEIIGGFDERYGSWGGEDQSAWAACWALTGYERIEGIQAHLWHPTEHGQREGSPTYPANDVLMRRYLTAKRDPVAMRALLSEPGGPLAVTPA